MIWRTCFILMFVPAALLVCQQPDNASMQRSPEYPAPILLPPVARVAPCELLRQPDQYNRQMVEVTGFISHGFENFSLFDPACPPWLGVWVEYGGTVNSGTIYCCGVTSDRVRREPLVVESIPIPLVEDETFRKFDSRVQTPGGTLVHATIRGRFFSGESPSEGTLGRGYGHMGCCSLLVIQQVIQLDDTVRESIDYDPFPGGLRVLLSGCRGQMFSGLFGIEKWLQAQRDAEDRKPWAFDDPRRVATEAFESSATVMVPPAEWKKFSAPQAGLLTGGNQIEQD